MQANRSTSNTILKEIPAAVNKVMGLQEWGLIFILSILWGGSFFFVGLIAIDGRLGKRLKRKRGSDYQI